MRFSRTLWVATLVFAASILTAAGGANAEEIPPAARKAGIEKAPAIIAKAGLGCTLTDARFIGQSDAKKDGANVTTAFFEVACSEGLGFLVESISDGSVPIVFDCVAMAGDVIGPDGTTKKNSLACVLPGNAAPEAGLQPMVSKIDKDCAIQKARYIGASSTNVYYELACQSGVGMVITASLPATVNRKVSSMSCATFAQTGHKCELTTSVQTYSPKQLLHLSCHLIFLDIPIDVTMKVDLENGTVNGYPATINADFIKFTILESDERKELWLKKGEKSHENRVTINRMSGSITNVSDFNGPSFGSCTKLEEAKF